jgi:hypothetical protein
VSARLFQRFRGIRAFGNEIEVPFSCQQTGKARPEEHLGVEQHEPYALNGSSSIVHAVNLTSDESDLPSAFAERSLLCRKDSKPPFG